MLILLQHVPNEAAIIGIWLPRAGSNHHLVAVDGQ
jgi:hypothetical protein